VTVTIGARRLPQQVGRTECAGKSVIFGRTPMRLVATDAVAVSLALLIGTVVRAFRYPTGPARLQRSRFPGDNGALGEGRDRVFALGPD
jgi:hypothetical protein